MLQIYKKKMHVELKTMDLNIFFLFFLLIFWFCHIPHSFVITFGFKPHNNSYCVEINKEINFRMGNSNNKLKEPKGLPWDFSNDIPIGLDRISIRNNPKIISLNEISILKFNYWLKMIGIVLEKPSEVLKITAIFITNNIDSHKKLLDKYNELRTVVKIRCFIDIVRYFLSIGMHADHSNKIASHVKNFSLFETTKTGDQRSFIILFYMR